MSPFPNLANDSRPLRADFRSGEDHEYYSSRPQQGYSESSLTASDDSLEGILDQGQYSDLAHQWEDGSASVFDGIELPIITEATLYIKNIDYDISDDALYSVFSQLGEITSHHIIRDATKRSRGFGFM